jgi:hypothetical protein
MISWQICRFGDRYGLVFDLHVNDSRGAFLVDLHPKLRRDCVPLKVNASSPLEDVDLHLRLLMWKRQRPDVA